MKKYILYNPVAGNAESAEKALKLQGLYIGHELIYLDISEISYPDFFASAEEDADIVLCGGDGTLNRFINAIDGLDIKNNIYYYATGSGNDFLKDIEKPAGAEPFLINGFLSSLPFAYIDGKLHRFINGVGCGLDGYTCMIGDRCRKNGKSINYTTTAIRSILFSYKPRNITVEIDGVIKSFKKVWLVSVMKGRFLGGGMMFTPNQDRQSEKLSVLILHDIGIPALLAVLPTVFSGGHVKYKRYVEIIEGESITISCDTPTPLQIDGEPIPEVKSLTASTIPKKAEAPLTV